jgi:hypothetical protein
VIINDNSQESVGSDHRLKIQLRQVLSYKIYDYKLFIFYSYYYIIIFSGSAAQRGLWPPAAQRGLWPPRSRGFVITHNDKPKSVGLLWTSDQVVAETFT